MRIFKLLQWLGSGCLLFAAPAESAMVAGSEFLSEWNLIVFDNLDSRAKIEGRAFVGGESRYRDGDDKSDGDDKAGELRSGESGKVGDAQGADYTEELFRQREELMRAAQGLSENLRSLAATGKASIEGETLRISGAAKENVFELSLDAFDKIGELRLDIPDGSTLVLNVAGKSGTISGKFDGSGLGKDSQLIWNFFEAEDLRFESDFYGTVLSPYASLRNDGSVEGTLVASSLDQRGALRMGGAQGFQQDISPVETVSVAPEPASWLMMIIGFGLVGNILRRYPIHAQATAFHLGKIPCRS